MSIKSVNNAYALSSALKIYSLFHYIRLRLQKASKSYFATLDILAVEHK